MGGLIVKLYRIIGIAVLALIVGMCSVSADSIAELSVAEGDVYASLSGTVNMLDLGFHENQLRYRSPYYPLQLAISVTNPETGERLYANQIQTEDDGTYSVKFILSEEEAVYNLTLYTAYGKVYEGEIEYKDGTVGKLNDVCETDDTDTLLDYLLNYNRYINVDMSLFNQFTDDEKTEVLETIIEKASYSTKADIRSAFSDAVFNIGLSTETLGDDDKNRMFNEYIESLPEEYNNIGGFITENSLGAGIIKLFNDGQYASVKDDIYVLSLKAFLDNNVENILALEALFENNLFSIPEDLYEKYEKEEQKTQFFKNLYGKRDDIEILDDFYNSVEKSIPVTVEDDSGRRGGGGGSGGRRGSVSGPSIPVIEPPKTDVNPNIDIKPDVSEAFLDLSSCEWAKTAIYELHKIGAVNGSNGEFLPNNSIKREEFAKIAAIAFGISEKTDKSMSFADVSKDAWYASSISAMSSNGIINGVSENEFGVGQLITRQDAATILSRILNLSENAEETEKFADDAQIADYAKSGVYTLRNGGMISGYEDGTFKPYAHITRAEAAQMIYNILKNQQKGGAALNE